MYVMIIAEKTGWEERFIRWDLPLSRGLAYYHAARLLAGERCRWPGRESRVKRWVKQVAGWLRNRHRG